MGFFEVFAAALSGFYALVPSFGLAIILLTIAVRVLLLPLSIKQTKSMREMQRIQPEVKKIQTKHKGDRQKMNEEMMALYKEHGVNPFGGCAPLLLQFPVLIGLFYVVRTPLAYMGYSPLREGSKVVDWVTRDGLTGIMATIQESALARGLDNMALELNQFLGIRLDCHSSAALSSQDPSNLGQACGSGLISALPYLVMVLLMGFTTWYQQKQMQARQDVTNNPQARQMQMFARIMPVMLMFFAFSFPSGVVLYWLTTNVWTIAQQRIMLASQPDDAKPASVSAKAQEKPPEEEARPKSKPHPSSKKKKRR